MPTPQTKTKAKIAHSRCRHLLGIWWHMCVRSTYQASTTIYSRNAKDYLSIKKTEYTCLACRVWICITRCSGVHTYVHTIYIVYGICVICVVVFRVHHVGGIIVACTYAQSTPSTHENQQQLRICKIWALCWQLLWKTLKTNARARRKTRNHSTHATTATNSGSVSQPNDAGACVLCVSEQSEDASAMCVENSGYRSNTHKQKSLRARAGGSPPLSSSLTRAANTRGTMAIKKRKYIFALYCYHSACVYILYALQSNMWRDGTPALAWPEEKNVPQPLLLIFGHAKRRTRPGPSVCL